MTFETWLQSRLTAHRFPVGAIDGIITNQTTREALMAFQKSHGMEPTGRADEHTVSLLRAPSSNVMPEIKSLLPDRDTAPLTETHQPSKTIWPRQADCMSFYGPVGTHQTQIEVPFEMYLAWSISTRVRKITLHEKVAASALIALEHIAEAYTPGDRIDLGINLFGGSLNVRRMRGGSAYSMHSWGIAIDFDPQRNQLHWNRNQARLAHPDAVLFWMAWEAQGWLSLGRAKNFDWMHVQAARL